MHCSFVEIFQLWKSSQEFSQNAKKNNWWWVNHNSLIFVKEILVTTDYPPPPVQIRQIRCITNYTTELTDLPWEPVTDSCRCCWHVDWRSVTTMTRYLHEAVAELPTVTSCPFYLQLLILPRLPAHFSAVALVVVVAHECMDRTLASERIWHWPG